MDPHAAILSIDHLSLDVNPIAYLDNIPVIPNPMNIQYSYEFSRPMRNIRCSPLAMAGTAGGNHRPLGFFIGA